MSVFYTTHQSYVFEIFQVKADAAWMHESDPSLVIEDESSTSMRQAIMSWGRSQSRETEGDEWNKETSGNHCKLNGRGSCRLVMSVHCLGHGA